MSRTLTLIVGSLVALVLITGAYGAGRIGWGANHPAATLDVSALTHNSQREFRALGVTASTLELIGAPNLRGTRLEGVMLYQVPSTKAGKCLTGVVGGSADGVECDPALFTAKMPGYATAGAYRSVVIAEGAPGQPPITKDSIEQVYGAALPSVKAVRLVGPSSGRTSIPTVDSGTGFVVFGDPDPPPDGELIELLDASGEVAQTIRIAPDDGSK
ncbi:MAG: hypothetical protein U0R50_00665 [Gaiellales bacterium]